MYITVCNVHTQVYRLHKTLSNLAFRFMWLIIVEIIDLSLEKCVKLTEKNVIYKKKKNC